MTREADRPFLGVMLMLAFCALAPMGDALAKIAGALAPLWPVVAARFALQAALLAPVALATGTGLRLGARVLRLTALRTALHVAGVFTMFLALRFLPLADAIAIAFVMPFFLLLLGRFVLGEAVGPRRLGAAAVGFAGTLCVVQPSFAEVGAAALLPVAVAVIFALFMLVTRAIARDADPVALQAASGAMAAAGLLPALLVGGALGLPEFGSLPASPRLWALVAMIGVAGTLAHLLLTWSLRYAPAATLAPMQYLEIPFAAAIGFAVFGELPDGLAAFGIVVTIGAGLYIVHRERRAAAAPLPSPPEV